MSDPIYVFFGIWPEARLWWREFWVPPADVIMASTPIPKIRKAVEGRRIIMIRGTSVPYGADGAERWRECAEWVRQYNTEHDWVSEVRQKTDPPTKGTS